MTHRTRGNEMKVGTWRVSPDKTQFNQGGLIFFDDVVHAIAFSPCGKLLAVGGQDKAPTVFLVQDFQKATLSCATSVRCLAWSPSSHLLLGAKTCRSLSGMCQLTKWSFKWTDWYSHVSFSSDGSWLATACFGSSVVALVPVEDQHGLGTASGGAATSAANTVTPTFHTTPRPWGR